MEVMEMFEPVAIALLTYLGKKTIDSFWSSRQSSNSLVVNHTGHITTSHRDAQGRTVIGSGLTGPAVPDHETLFGDLYLPDTLQDFLLGDEIVLVLVIGEDNQEVILFEADIDTGYEIDLQHGLYSIFVFVMDPEEPDFLNATIFAVGLPCAEHIDLSGIESFFLDEDEDIWNLVDLSPVEITRGGPFYLDFILFDTEQEPEFPLSLSELL